MICAFCFFFHILFLVAVGVVELPKNHLLEMSSSGAMGARDPPQLPIHGDFLDALSEGGSSDELQDCSCDCSHEIRRQVQGGHL